MYSRLSGLSQWEISRREKVLQLFT